MPRDKLHNGISCSTSFSTVAGQFEHDFSIHLIGNTDKNVL